MNFIKNKKLILCFFIFLLVSFFIGVNFCLAEGLVPDGGKKETGDYTLNDFVRVAANVSQWILGIVGSLALLMFVYGGLMMMLAGVSTIAEGGKDKKINKGKDAIRNAIIGLIIVFTAYIIIGFVFKVTGADLTETAWSTAGWFK